MLAADYAGGLARNKGRQRPDGPLHSGGSKPRESVLETPRHDGVLLWASPGAKHTRGMGCRGGGRGAEGLFEMRRSRGAGARERSGVVLGVEVRDRHGPGRLAVRAGPP